MHRADAALAVGREYTLDQDVAVDAIDEWLELGSLPTHFEVHPRMRELLGPGRTLHFHATDTAPQAAAEWLMTSPVTPLPGAAHTRKRRWPRAAR